MTIADVYKLLFGRSNIKDGTVIDMAEHGRVGGTSAGQGFKFTQDVDEMTAIQTSGSNTFVGNAPPGTALSDALWQAQKIDANGNITWADGDANFDNVATDLTALTYS